MQTKNTIVISTVSNIKLWLEDLKADTLILQLSYCKYGHYEECPWVNIEKYIHLTTINKMTVHYRCYAFLKILPLTLKLENCFQETIIVGV